MQDSKCPLCLQTLILVSLHTFLGVGLDVGVGGQGVGVGGTGVGVGATQHKGGVGLGVATGGVGHGVEDGVGLEYTLLSELQSSQRPQPNNPIKIITKNT